MERPSSNEEGDNNAVTRDPSSDEANETQVKKPASSEKKKQFTCGGLEVATPSRSPLNSMERSSTDNDGLHGCSTSAHGGASAQAAGPHSDQTHYRGNNNTNYYVHNIFSYGKFYSSIHAWFWMVVKMDDNLIMGDSDDIARYL